MKGQMGVEMETEVGMWMGQVGNGMDNKDGSEVMMEKERGVEVRLGMGMG